MKFIQFAILYFSLYSCDPIHTIDILNNTESDLSIEIQLKGNYPLEIIPNQPKEDSLSIHLRQGETESLYFGIGTWSEYEIRQTANLVKNLTVRTDSLEFNTSSVEFIERTLENNTEGGWWKTGIHITIE